MVPALRYLDGQWQMPFECSINCEGQSLKQHPQATILDQLEVPKQNWTKVLLLASRKH